MSCCGWFGGPARDDAAAILARMSATMPVAGEGGGQSWTFGSVGLAVGGGGPAWLASSPELACAILGYPAWRDPNLAAVAAQQNHAAALAQAYRRTGEGLFGAIRGPFSLAVLDLERERALIAIDRFGVETMCWARAGDGALVFGSTADAVRAYPGVTATLSLQALFEFLFFIDRVPAPRTVYNEVSKLAPAEYLLAERDRVVARRYWQMPYRDAASIDGRAAAEELKRLLRKSVAESLDGEDPSKVGTFLSGGLDSSTMTGLAVERVPGVKSFTIGFPVEGFDESGFAEIAAKRFGTTQQTFPFTPEEVMRVLQRCITVYDEPFANSSAVPTFRCAEMARAAGVDLMIAGDGGDELFAGNERYVGDRVFDHYATIPHWLRRALIEPVVDWPLSERIALLRKVARYAKLGRLPVPERMIHNIYERIEPTRVFTAEAWREIDPVATKDFASAVYELEGGADKVQRMMNFDLRITLADSDLRKVGRMCALAGVRVRYPFLDEDVAEFSATLPKSVLLEGGELRAFYKKAMVGFLPNEILTKQKHGFGLPYFQFITAYPPLRALVCDTLNQLKARRFFRPEFLGGIVERVGNAVAQPVDAVAWDLFVLEQWLQSRPAASA